MGDSVSIFDRMTALLDKSSIEEMWGSWCLIANEVIPRGYDLRDAAEGSLSPFDSVMEINEEWIRDRIEYLSDRADPSRVYWLDSAIRWYLNKESRDKEGGL